MNFALAIAYAGEILYLKMVIGIISQGSAEYELEVRMGYFLKTTTPEDATGQLGDTYQKLESMFQMVPKVFIAQSIRPDLLEPMVAYVNNLLIETHALPRGTKELIAAYVSRINGCEY